jgi:hypothetical protein
MAVRDTSGPACMRTPLVRWIYYYLDIDDSEQSPCSSDTGGGSEAGTVCDDAHVEVTPPSVSIIRGSARPMSVFAGKVVLVTGASSGLGAAAAPHSHTVRAHGGMAGIGRRAKR